MAGNQGVVRNACSWPKQTTERSAENVCCWPLADVAEHHRDVGFQVTTWHRQKAPSLVAATDRRSLSKSITVDSD